MLLLLSGACSLYWRCVRGRSVVIILVVVAVSVLVVTIVISALGVFGFALANHLESGPSVVVSDVVHLFLKRFYLGHDLVEGGFNVVGGDDIRAITGLGDGYVACADKPSKASHFFGDLVNLCVFKNVGCAWCAGSFQC